MSGLSMSRRGFLKAAALAGAAAAVGSVTPVRGLAEEAIHFALKEDGDTKVI